MKDKKAAETGPDHAMLRIDKLLWFLRFAGNRAMAKKLANAGHVRLNGRRVDRAHMMVKQGDILTIPHGRDVYVIRITELPLRRGSAPDAQSCFEHLRVAQ